MSATVMTPFSPKRAYADYPFSANDLDVTLSTGNNTDGNEWSVRAGDVLYALNTDDGAHTFTLQSVEDAQGREGDINAYSLGAGEVAAVTIDKTIGWADSGIVHVDCNDATIMFWVHR